LSEGFNYQTLHVGLFCSTVFSSLTDSSKFARPVKSCSYPISHHINTSSLLCLEVQRQECRSSSCYLIVSNLHHFIKLSPQYFWV